MLTQAQIDQFHRDGFLRIPGVFSGQELDDLRAAADQVEAEGLARKDPETHRYQRLPNGKQQYFRSERMWSRAAIFRAVTVKPSLLAAIGQCTGLPFLPINDSFVAKLPHTEVPIAWHQDVPYGQAKRPSTLGAPNFDTDIYLDDSTIENGCVYGIPGHHLSGDVDIANFTQEELFNHPDAVPIEMKAGDVLFHCISAPHGSRINPTASKRRIFYVHYMPAIVREELYAFWTNKGMDFNADGIARVKGFIADRQALGLDNDLGTDLHLDETGFSWTGNPSTPADHWQQLIDAMSSEEHAQRQQLLSATAS